LINYIACIVAISKSRTEGLSFITWTIT